MREFQDMFRPNYEGVAAIAWMLSIVLLLLFRLPGWPGFLVVALILAAFRTREMIDLYKFRLSISSIRLSFMPIVEVVEKCKRIRDKRNCFWLGTGFIWSQKHAETARQIIYRNPGEITDLPLLVKMLIERAGNVPVEKRNLFQKLL